MSSSRNLVASVVMLGMWLAGFALMQDASVVASGAAADGGLRLASVEHSTLSLNAPAVVDRHQELNADVEDDAPDDVCIEVSGLGLRAPPRHGVTPQRGIDCFRSQWRVLAARGPPQT